MRLFALLPQRPCGPLIRTWKGPGPNTIATGLTVHGLVGSMDRHDDPYNNVNGKNFIKT